MMDYIIEESYVNPETGKRNVRIRIKASAVDPAATLAAIPADDFEPGSVAFVTGRAKTWEFDIDGTWVEVG